MKFLLLLATYVCLFSQSDHERKFNAIMNNPNLTEAEKQLRFYYQLEKITPDTTLYSIEEKTKKIETAFLNSDYDYLRRLYFFPSDTALPIRSIRQWQSALYSDGEDRLITVLFYPRYQTERFVLYTLYKRNSFSAFISAYEKSKIKNNDLLDLMVADVYYKTKVYENVLAMGEIPSTHKKYVELTKIQMRSAFQMREYKKATELFGKLKNDYTQELVFLAAKSHHQLGNYKIASSLLREYIKFFEKNDLRELQLAYYYQGLGFQEQDQLTFAKQYYGKAVEKNPKYKSLKAFIHQSLASYYEEKKDYSAAAGEWKSYLALLTKKKSKKYKDISERITELEEKAFFAQGKKDAAAKKKN